MPASWIKRNAHQNSRITLAEFPATAVPAGTSRLLEDRALRQHMGLLGAARLEEHFGVGRMVSGTVAAYEKYGH